MAAVTPESGTGTTISANDRRFAGELTPEFFAALLHRAAEDHAVRTRKIHVLEDAAGLRAGGSVEARSNALRTDDHQFTRLHVALVGRADQIEGAGFGSENNGVVLLARLGGNPAHGQRAEAARIAGGKDPVGADHDQRERAFHAAKRVGNGIGKGLLPGKRDQVNNYFGVAVGLEDRSLALQPAANFRCVDQVAVVRQRDGAFIRLHHDGLGIEQRRISGSGVPRVADGERAMQPGENVFGEDVGHQAHGSVGVSAMPFELTMPADSWPRCCSAWRPR